MWRWSWEFSISQSQLYAHPHFAYFIHTLAPTALCMSLNEIHTTFNPTPWHPRVHYLLYVCVVWISVIPYKKYNTQRGFL